MWKECLDSDTYLQGKGSTVARVTDGSLFFHPLTAISGVATSWMILIGVDILFAQSQLVMLFGRIGMETFALFRTDRRRMV